MKGMKVNIISTVNIISFNVVLTTAISNKIKAGQWVLLKNQKWWTEKVVKGLAHSQFIRYPIRTFVPLLTKKEHKLKPKIMFSFWSHIWTHMKQMKFVMKTASQCNQQIIIWYWKCWSSKSNGQADIYWREVWQLCDH